MAGHAANLLGSWHIRDKGLPAAQSGITVTAFPSLSRFGGLPLPPWVSGFPGGIGASCLRIPPHSGKRAYVRTLVVRQLTRGTTHWNGKCGGGGPLRRCSERGERRSTAAVAS